MAVLVHDDAIVLKMAELATVSASAKKVITPQIISSASREMLQNLGDTAYATYVADFDAYPTLEAFEVFDDKEFNALDSDERSLRSLIFGEAYFALYHLSLALRKLVKGSVNTERESSGSNSVATAPYDEILSKAESYRELAFESISFAIPSDSEDEIYYDGTFAGFVV